VRSGTQWFVHFTVIIQGKGEERRGRSQLFTDNLDLIIGLVYGRNVEHAKHANVSEILRTLAYLDVREAELEEEAIGVCDVLIPRSATKDPHDIQI